jgi:uncharacterized protein with ATP-grasp and redox domains
MDSKKVNLLKKNIFFLLKIKCAVVAENFNGKYKVGDIAIDRIG